MKIINQLENLSNVKCFDSLKKYLKFKRNNQCVSIYKTLGNTNYRLILKDNWEIIIPNDNMKIETSEIDGITPFYQSYSMSKDDGIQFIENNNQIQFVVLFV